MSRYLVTVKIVHTWYEEIIVEAESEDGAELMAETESVQPIGDPVVDRYAYCNWVIDDVEQNMDADDMDSRSDFSTAADAEAAQAETKKPRTRRRRSRSRPKTDAEQQETAATTEINDSQQPIVEEPPAEMPQVEAASVETPPTRTKRNYRRRRARKGTAADQPSEPLTGELQTTPPDSSAE
jgi:hypothetical protein